MKKRVMHIINGLGQGGAETTLYKLLCSLQNDNYEFYVVSLTKHNYYVPYIEKLGISVYCLELDKTNIFVKFFQLIKLIKKVKPDIVQTWLYFSDLFGGVAAKLAGTKKIVWGIRCEGVNLKSTTQMIKQVCARLSKFVPNVIVTNSEVAAKHHINAGYDERKVKIITNGYNDGEFFPTSKSEITTIIANKLPENALLIGTLARFHADKDYANLLNAIDDICQNYPNTYFILCGVGCNEKNVELMHLMHHVKYRDHIVLINGVSDSNAYLNMLDIFVLPSKTEGFPNVLAEAMLCGLPCVATDVGDVKKILSDKGIVISSEDSKQLASACINLLKKSGEERQMIGLQGRSWIQKQFSMSVMEMKYKSIYEQ